MWVFFFFKFVPKGDLDQQRLLGCLLGSLILIVFYWSQSVCLHWRSSEICFVLNAPVGHMLWPLTSLSELSNAPKKIKTISLVCVCFMCMLQLWRRPNGRRVMSEPGSTMRSTWRRGGKGWRSSGWRKIKGELPWRRNDGKNWRRTGYFFSRVPCNDAANR